MLQSKLYPLATGPSGNGDEQAHCLLSRCGQLGRCWVLQGIGCLGLGMLGCRSDMWTTSASCAKPLFCKASTTTTRVSPAASPTVGGSQAPQRPDEKHRFVSLRLHWTS